MPNVPWCHTCGKPDGICDCKPALPGDVERNAEEFVDSWYNATRGETEVIGVDLEELTRRVATILSRAPAADGWVRVPREPTEAMVIAGSVTPGMVEVDQCVMVATLHGAKLTHEGWQDSPIAQAYRAMLKEAAAPSATAEVDRAKE